MIFWAPNSTDRLVKVEISMPFPAYLSSWVRPWGLMLISLIYMKISIRRNPSVLLDYFLRVV